MRHNTNNGRQAHAQTYMRSQMTGKFAGNGIKMPSEADSNQWDTHDHKLMAHNEVLVRLPNEGLGGEKLAALSGPVTVIRPARKSF